LTTTAATTHTPSHATDHLHAAFLTILPRIELHGRVYFRHKKGDKRDEAIAEMVALAWKSFVNCVRNGKNPLEFPMALARRAAQGVHNGRRLCGQEKIKDVLSPRAQQQHNFTVVSLPEGSSLHGNVFDEALIDNTQTPVPDQVSFRIDFPAWRLTRSERDRRVIDDLMLGERTLDVADKHGLTAGRVSQLRRDFQQDWERFCNLDDELQG
jgi:hypothetical protein